MDTRRTSTSNSYIVYIDFRDELLKEIERKKREKDLEYNLKMKEHLMMGE
jgi:hypothetical protein